MKRILIIVALLLTTVLQFVSCKENNDPSHGLAYLVDEENGAVTINGRGRCSATDIEIPSELEGYPVRYIADRAFQNDIDLKSVTIPNSVTSIECGAFNSCNRLETITLPFVGATIDGTSNTHFGYIFGASSSSDNSDRVPSSLKTVIITGGTSIGDRAFYKCNKLTSVTILDSGTNIGAAAFSCCSKLASITIPNSVTNIGDSAFYKCIKLTSVTIPNSVTSIGSHAFAECSGLTTVDFANTDGWYVKDNYFEMNMTVTNAFTNATNLTTNYYSCYWYRK